MRYREAGVIALGLVLALPLARADDELDKLRKDYVSAASKWSEQMQRSHSQPATESGPMDPSNEFNEKFKAFAEAHAGKPEALDALMEIMQHPALMYRGGEKIAVLEWAVQRVTRDHAGDARVKEIIPRLGWQARWVESGSLLKLFDAVAQANHDPETVAQAMLAKAKVYQLEAEDCEKSAREEKLKKALDAFREVLRTHPNSDAAKQAGANVFEIEHLQIGMTPPDFQGEDVEGKTIHLKDFRGKVAVLDFWGFW